ncbi:MAG: hypothetical protein ABSE48_19250 [Verrucomicrobiota bacterium]
MFAGSTPHVNHLVNHRNLAFHNANHVPVDIELAAGDEGLAFRYRFTQFASKFQHLLTLLMLILMPILFEQVIRGVGGISEAR